MVLTNPKVTILEQAQRKLALWNDFLLMSCCWWQVPHESVQTLLNEPSSFAPVPFPSLCELYDGNYRSQLAAAPLSSDHVLYSILSTHRETFFIYNKQIRKKKISQ